MEPRAEADITAPPSDMLDIGSDPCKPCHFNFPKRLLVRKTLCTTRTKLHDLIDAGGYNMILEEMWPFVLLA